MAQNPDPRAQKLWHALNASVSALEDALETHTPQEQKELAMQMDLIIQELERILELLDHGNHHHTD